MSTLRPPAADDAGGPAHPASPRSPYAEALSQADLDLDEALGHIRAEEDAHRLNPAAAAAERAELLERHLARLAEIRAGHTS